MNDVDVHVKERRASRQIGLSLDEIAAVIELYFNDPTGARGKKKLLGILERQLNETEKKIADLRNFRADLRATISRVEQTIKGASRAKA